MRSPIGAAGAAVMLLSLPIAILCDMFFPAAASAVIHLLFAAGMAMLLLAMFDLRSAEWARGFGLIGAGGLAAVFAIQGISDIVGNPSLAFVAYGLLGQGLESGLAYLVAAWWLAAILADDGWTKALGLVLIVVFLLAELYANVTKTFDMPPPAEILKLAKLLPFVWLLAASVERNRPASTRMA